MLFLFDSHIEAPLQKLSIRRMYCFEISIQRLNRLHKGRASNDKYDILFTKSCLEKHFFVPGLTRVSIITFAASYSELSYKIIFLETHLQNHVIETCYRSVFFE